MPLGVFKQTILGAAGVSTSDIEQISVTTMSGESTLELAIASGYSSLIWAFSNLDPSANESDLTFQTSINGTYNTPTTSSNFKCFQYNSGSSNNLEYQSHFSEGNSTGKIPISPDGDDGTNCSCAVAGCAVMQLWNPTSSVYGKNWIVRAGSGYPGLGGGVGDWHTAGYVNTTSALTGIQFSYITPTANFDGGKIYYWGVK